MGITKAVSMLEPTTEPWGQRTCYVADPEGDLIGIGPYDIPEFSEEDYSTIDEIREIRNYWCHQCYLDFVYIVNDNEREETFQKVAQKLHYDEYRTYDLFEKTEAMRSVIMKKYR